MNESFSKKVHEITTSYDDGGTNKFYDFTDHIRIPFPPNRNGVYRIEINEVQFTNSEQTLIKDVDYFEFKVTYADADHTTGTVRYTMRKDIYSYIEAPNRNDILKSLLGATTHVNSNLTNVGACTLSAYGSYDNSEWSGPMDASTQQNSFYNLMRFRANITPATGKTIESVEMSFSTNFAYVLNCMNAKIIGVHYQGNSYDFTFQNMRTAGAFIYILDTNINADTKTYNSLNQGYNIMARTWNYGSVHNTPQQMNSTMSGTAADLSNLRFRILNDQYEPVLIKSPFMVTYTVSNAD